MNPPIHVKETFHDVLTRTEGLLSVGNMEEMDKKDLIVLIDVLYDCATTMEMDLIWANDIIDGVILSDVSTGIKQQAKGFNGYFLRTYG